uniref:ORF2 protein n=1 Tax=Spodoptera exigua virus AKJ-2014 TaxID=1453322 RepID=A0A023NFV2_9PICO|nr:ORF2 protein [Spodoptera exigua virus AKJ-2014]
MSITKRIINQCVLINQTVLYALQKKEYALLGVVLILLGLVFNVPLTNTFMEMFLYTMVVRFLMGSPMEVITTFFTQLTNYSETFVTQVKEVTVEAVSEGLRDIRDAATPDIVSFKNLSTNFLDHKIGIATCVASASQATSAVQVGSEIIKVGSMLGLEKSLLGNVVNAVVHRGADLVIPRIDEHGLEDCVPLVATAAAMAGTEFLDFNIETTLKRAAQNTKAMETLVAHTRKVCEQSGIIQRPGYTELMKINERIEKLRDETLWITQMLGINGSVFNTPDGKKRVTEYKHEIDSLMRELKNIGQSTVKDTSLYTELHYHLVKSMDMLSQISAIQASSGLRMVPVGINIFGDSQIGKSMLVQEINKRVQQQLLAEHVNLPRVGQWQIWHMQQRDEFDTNYYSQEVAYCDDGWSDKTNKDHQQWLNFISPAPIGTVQAQLNQKGAPFQANMCIVTSNTLPRTSIAINNINALHARFPVCVKATRIGRPSSTYDPDFKHLKFSVGTMTMQLNPETSNCVELDLNGITKMIVRHLKKNLELYQSQTTIISQAQDIVDQAPATLEQHVDRHELPAVRSQGMPRLEGTRLKEILGLKREWRTARNQPPIIGLNQFGRWTQYLRHRTTNQTVAEWVAGSPDLTAFEFISALGIWIVPPEHIEAFKVAFAEQPIIRVEDHYETPYYWGPRIEGGSLLVVHVPAVDVIIDNFLTSTGMEQEIREFHRAIASMAITLGVQVFLGCVDANVALELLGTAVSVATWSPMLRETPWYQAFRHSAGLVAAKTLAAVFSPFTALYQRIHSRISQITIRIGDILVSMSISLLELIGVEVTPTTETWLVGASTVAIEMLTAAVVVVIGYLLIQLYKKMTAPPVDQVIEHGRSYEGKVKKEKLREKTKSGKMMKIRQHAESKNVQSYSQEHIQKDVDWKEHLLDMMDEGLSAGTDALYYSFTPQDRTVVFEHFKNDVNMTGTDYLKFERMRVPIDDPDPELVQLVSAVCYEFEKSGTQTEVENYLVNILDKISGLVGQTNIKLVVSTEVTDDDMYRIQCFICIPRREEKGKQITHTRKHLKEAEAFVAVLQGCEPTQLVDSIIQHGLHVDIKSVRNRFEVAVTGIVSPTSVCHGFGLGSGTTVICNAHITCKDGIVLVRRRGETSGRYQVAQVTSFDNLRDLAFCRILPVDQAGAPVSTLRPEVLIPHHKNLTYQPFPDLTPHLMSFKDLMDLNGSAVMVVAPRSDLVITGTLGYSEGWFSAGLQQFERKHITITGLAVTLELPQKGDSGGVMMATTRKMNNGIIGIYTGTSKRTLLGAYLVREDFVELHGLHQEDTWMQLIAPMKTHNVPDGSAVTAIGEYRYDNVPISRPQHVKWVRAPWGFTVTTAPPPLSPHDERIEVELPKNSLGEPSLLMKQVLPLAEAIPDVNQQHLDQYVKYRVEQLRVLMQIADTPEDLDAVFEYGINGHPTNEHVKGIYTNSSSGLPWTSSSDRQLKKDMLDTDPLTGHVSVNDKGHALRKRVYTILERANNGVRSVVLVASKLKDQCIKLKHVKNGKVRVFHAVPVEKIIADSSLFGNFKEAYMNLGLRLDHAIGIDPNSPQWGEIVKHLKHDLYLDMDFTQYDKRMHSQCMYAFYSIIRGLIKDKWSNARDVLGDMSVRSWVVDYKSVYETSRGNKSGEFLTTVINSEVNRMYSWLAWVAITGRSDYTEWQENVSLVTFGDDKLEGVSETFSGIYHYQALKEFYSGIGHTITSDTLDDSGQRFSKLDELKFLKRKFVSVDGVITAPLEVESIENPFVWTQMMDFDFGLWKPLIAESLLEASLHGREYYEFFVNMLKKCKSRVLLREIIDLLLSEYDDSKRKMMERYVGHRIW